jgi:hypothetical protein
MLVLWAKMPRDLNFLKPLLTKAFELEIEVEA